jgi:hypothetical protein
MSKKRDRDGGGENLEPKDSPAFDETAPEPVEVASEVAPVEPKEAPQEVAPPKAEPAPTDPANLMPLRVYATIAGPKWDQMAGFVNFARRNKLGPMTMTEWQQAHKRFMNRPVG